MESQSVLSYQDVAQPTPVHGLSAKKLADAVVIEATCPRCDHLTATHLPIGVIAPAMKGIVRRSVDIPAGRYDTVMVCSCGYPHPGRPPEETGCGAYWRVAMEV